MNVIDLKRSTFRSGTPEPPKILQNFYDSFFWYGMDMSESTVPSDKTIFGGTKGKFNGLDIVTDRNNLVDEMDGDQMRRRRPKPVKRTVDYEDYEDYDDNDYGDVRKIDKYDSRYEDDEEEDDYVPRYAKRSYSANKRSKKREPTRQGERSSRSVRRDHMAVKKDISTWFTSEDDSKYDDDESYEQEGNPIGMFLDKVFNVDTEERKRLADAYDQRMGIKKKEKTTRYNDDGNTPIADYIPTTITRDDYDEYDDMDTVIDINATSTSETTIFETKKKSLTEPEIPEIKMSWKERAGQVERIPPSGIAAWGPNGEVMDVEDAREAAALSAKAEIAAAEERVKELLEKMENAREKVTLLQA